jgi:hypothetical protein
MYWIIVRISIGKFGRVFNGPAGENREAEPNSFHPSPSKLGFHSQSLDASFHSQPHAGRQAPSAVSRWVSPSPSQFLSLSPPALDRRRRPCLADGRGASAKEPRRCVGRNPSRRQGGLGRTGFEGRVQEASI